ncbi:MAG: lytic transglycosylase domain-containing protein [Bacteroidales bacterium]|nr:lytic transglycosylase domain-containing protein [Bacteroidales bacterium]MDD4602689.1 lytic transglycosylase domain-containing protein [Bacteroidales bacterium]
MKQSCLIFGGMVILILGLVAIVSFVDFKSKDREYENLFYRHTKVFAPELPLKANFSGEDVPMDIYYVKESFDREILANTFMHTSTILMFKRANRWFPVIEPILKRNGIPDDFKYLALAESNLANVVSPAGAEGYWQFIKPTGIKYGLEINENVDERYHITKATEAACHYFQDAFRTFKSWTLVAASYNRGIDGMSKALGAQKVHNYYDLYLNDETSRYVYRILALKEVYNHPVRYGFYLRIADFYPSIPTKSISVDSTIKDLPLFAKNLSINFRILRELNPWIQNYSLPNKSKKVYTILVPKEGTLRNSSTIKKVLSNETFFHDTLTINEVH